MTSLNEQSNQTHTPKFSTFYQLFTFFVPSKGFNMGALFRAMSTNLLPPLGAFTTLRWSCSYSGSPLSWRGLAAPVSTNYTWWGLTCRAGLTGCWLNTFWPLSLRLLCQYENYLCGGVHQAYICMILGESWSMKLVFFFFFFFDSGKFGVSSVTELSHFRKHTLLSSHTGELRSTNSSILLSTHNVVGS